MKAWLALPLILNLTCAAQAETGAAFQSQYRIEQKLIPGLRAQQEQAEIAAAIEKQFAAERAQYEERLQVIDLNYKYDDPVCRPLRDAERKIAQKKRQEQLALKYQIEDRIRAKCHSTNYDMYVDFIGKLVDSAKNAALINPDHFSEGTKRFQHKLLSPEAAEILNYPHLDQVLARDCFANDRFKDIKMNYFKIALVEDDIAPATLGTAGGLITGWYAFKGLGKLLWTPVKGLLQATKAGPTAYKVANGASWLLTTGLFTTLFAGHTYIQYEEFERISDQAQAEEEIFDIMSRLDYESTFPDLYARQALNKCYEHLQYLSTKKPGDATYELWLKTAESNCQNFIDRAAIGLDRLQTYDMARCHAGNKNAEQNIRRDVDAAIKKWPALKDYAQSKGL